MADLRISVSKTILNEGGYVDNPSDSGGATKYGITQADLPGRDIEQLTVGEAVAYYAEHYVKALYNQIEDQHVADKLFDLGVLFGIQTAVRTLQIILNLTADGQFGPVTLSAVNGADSTSLLLAYKAGMVTHASQVAAHNPEDRIFVAGWIHRINS